MPFFHPYTAFKRSVRGIFLNLADCYGLRHQPIKINMAENSTGKIRIGITQGDINGIGYEVILKMLDDERMLGMLLP